MVALKIRVMLAHARSGIGKAEPAGKKARIHPFAFFRKLESQEEDDGGAGAGAGGASSHTNMVNIFSEDKKVLSIVFLDIFILGRHSCEFVKALKLPFKLFIIR